jgi:hypothetical protein
MKTLIGLVVAGLLLGLGLSIQAASWAVGSAFLSGVGGTNAYQLPAVANGSGITNIPAAHASNIVVSAGGPLALSVDVVSGTAAGTANNGWLQLDFAGTVDGGTWTAVTNTKAFSVSVPCDGTVRVVYVTNLAETVNAAYYAVKLQRVVNTNAAAYWISNVLFRVQGM